MNINLFAKTFFDIEFELKLFYQNIDGIYWWEVVRHDVFYYIYDRVSGADSSRVSQKSLVKRIFNFGMIRLLRLNLQIKLALFQYDILALRAPRNVRKDGRRFDTVLDDILACYSGRVLVIDTFPYYYHIDTCKAIENFTGLDIIQKLSSEIQSRFGFIPDFADFISLRINSYKSSLYQYGKIIKKCRPKCIVLVQNGIEKALFSAAFDHGIPVVEAQHGLIGNVHPAYSYPQEIKPGSLKTLPTYFLAFSQRWIDQVNYPVKKSIVIGNRRFYVVPQSGKSNSVLILSAAPYESAIDRIIIPAAERDMKRMFLYKLHPNQFHRKVEIKGRFSKYPNIKVIAASESLHELIGQCSIGLCVQSTGVYEMLQGGVVVFLIDKQDYQTHIDVFDSPNVRIIGDVSQFMKGLVECEQRPSTAAISAFFNDFNSDVTKEFFNQVCR